MDELHCDLCGAPVAPVYAQPKGLRPGRLTAPPQVIAGYRCSNSECRTRDGFGMRGPAVPSV